MQQECVLKMLALLFIFFANIPRDAILKTWTTEC